MHKLYEKVIYLLVGKDEHHLENFIIYDKHIFTEEEKPLFELTEYKDFDSFYQDALNHTYCKAGLVAQESRTCHKKYVEANTLMLNFSIKPYHFKRNYIAVKTDYIEKTTGEYSIETFKNILSVDDFVIFLREHFGVAMDIETLKIMLGK